MIHRIKHHLIRHAHRAKHHLHNAFVPHEGNDHRPHALRSRALTAYAIVVVAVKVAVTALVAVYPGPVATSNLTPKNVVVTTNAARDSESVKTLRENPILTQAANLKAQDMLSKGYFAHISPTKVTPWFWFQKAGYKYSSAGENLAIDFTTAEDVTEAWLNSPSHRKNLLNPKYQDIGVAVSSGTIKGTAATVVVQFFGAPAATVQKPKVVPKVTPAKPASKPQPSKVASTTPKVEPLPILGETTEEPPLPPLPATPTLTSPESGLVLATSQPWIGGEAQEETRIVLTADGQVVGETVSDARGYFQLQPTSALADGTHAMTAHAVNERGSSPSSGSINVTVDTQPPSAGLRASMMLPSFVNAGGFTVVGLLEGEDITSAALIIGSQTSPVQVTGQRVLVEMTTRPSDGADQVSLELQDPVGNASRVAVGSLSFFESQAVQAPSGGMLSFFPKVVFYSRTFFITFWLFVFLALAINIIIKIQIQHRPTILYSLLLLYGLTIILII